MGLERDFEVLRNVANGLEKFFATVDMRGCSAVASLFKCVQLHFDLILQTHSPEEFERQVKNAGGGGDMARVDVGAVVAAVSDWVLGSQYSHPRLPATILGLLLFRAEMVDGINFEDVRKVIAQLKSQNSNSDEAMVGLLNLGFPKDGDPKMAVLSRKKKEDLEEAVRGVIKSRAKEGFAPQSPEAEKEIDDALDAIMDILEKEEEDDERKGKEGNDAES